MCSDETVLIMVARRERHCHTTVLERTNCQSESTLLTNEPFAKNQRSAASDARASSMKKINAAAISTRWRTAATKQQPWPATNNARNERRTTRALQHDHGQSRKHKQERIETKPKGAPCSHRCEVARRQAREHSDEPTRHSTRPTRRQRRVFSCRAGARNTGEL